MKRTKARSWRMSNSQKSRNQPRSRGLYLNLVVTFGFLITLCYSACHWEKNKMPPRGQRVEGCWRDGELHPLKSHFKSLETCEECECFERGVHCCEQDKVPVGYNPKICIAKKEKCVHKVVRKKDHSIPCPFKLVEIDSDSSDSSDSSDDNDDFSMKDYLELLSYFDGSDECDEDEESHEDHNHDHGDYSKSYEKSHEQPSVESTQHHNSVQEHNTDKSDHQMSPKQKILDMISKQKQASKPSAGRKPENARVSRKQGVLDSIRSHIARGAVQGASPGIVPQRPNGNKRFPPILNAKLNLKRN
ncbi:uncharacterized protein [Hyperolius riggenbachi]|uniref:uncharacterized protein n=1 Tax=Hyperolius riggenbachi TaxID=752182 RepID=UPI0035A3AB88